MFVGINSFFTFCIFCRVIYNKKESQNAIDFKGKVVVQINYLSIECRVKIVIKITIIIAF